MKYCKVKIQELIARVIQPVNPEIVEKRIISLINNKFLTKERYKKYTKKVDGRNKELLLRKNYKYGSNIPEEKLSYKKWAIKEFNKKCNLEISGLEIRITLEEDVLSAIIYNPLDSYDVELNKIIKDLGYYVLSINEVQRPIEEYIFILGPIYGELLLDIPKKLYHITSVNNIDRILKKGLIPYKGNRQDYLYPPSVFLITKYNLPKILELWLEIQTHGVDIEDKYHGRFSYEYPVVFEINSDKLRRGTKFYIDPSHPQTGVYTFTHIPADALKIKYQEKKYDEESGSYIDTDKNINIWDEVE